MICNIIYVCAFLGMQSLRIGLVLEVLCSIIFRKKYLFWTVSTDSDILF